MLYFDYNEYIKEGICFMLIQDDALRSVIARTLRVKEDELTEDLMKELVHLEVQDHEIETLEGLQYAENLETGSLTLTHSQNSQKSFRYGFFCVKFLIFNVVCVVYL